MFNKKNIQIFIYGSCIIGTLNATEIDIQKQSRPKEILVKQEVNISQIKNTQNITQAQKADLIIISENNPQYLRQMIESILKYTPNIEKIYVLKDPCYGQYRDLYNSIKDDHNEVEFIKVGPSNFKSMLESIVQLNHNKHVLISTSNIIFTDYVDFNKLIKFIDQKNSPLFYLNPCDQKDILKQENQSCFNNLKDSENQKLSGETNLTQNTENLEILDNEATEESPIEQENVFMWQFKNNFTKNTPNMALYKKSDLLDTITPLDYTCLQELLKILSN
ncbi:MAG: hypothetical protein UR12_C0013G0008 [candidate division TM6 bacterium GW2011_GWF2_30_66]|jgi:hypothetical protein|nr:MAG: hypothetical protein UR12_C0013G0008 [candidate division TM6 bacterium GW2011_GWF2_30_66]